MSPSSAAGAAVVSLLLTLSCSAARGVPAEPAPDQAAGLRDAADGRQLFERHCSICHGLELPKSQRLDRENWDWVLDDMINTYGASWITDAERALILEYLVENFSPSQS